MALVGRLMTNIGLIKAKLNDKDKLDQLMCRKSSTNTSQVVFIQSNHNYTLNYSELAYDFMLAIYPILAPFL